MHVHKLYKNILGFKQFKFTKIFKFENKFKNFNKINLMRRNKFYYLELKNYFFLYFCDAYDGNIQF